VTPRPGRPPPRGARRNTPPHGARPGGPGRRAGQTPRVRAAGPRVPWTGLVTPHGGALHAVRLRLRAEKAARLDLGLSAPASATGVALSLRRVRASAHSRPMEPATLTADPGSRASSSANASSVMCKRWTLVHGDAVETRASREGASGKDEPFVSERVGAAVVATDAQLVGDAPYHALEPVEAIGFGQLAEAVEAHVVLHPEGGAHGRRRQAVAHVSGERLAHLVRLEHPRRLGAGRPCAHLLIRAGAIEVVVACVKARGSPASASVFRGSPRTSALACRSPARRLRVAARS
jgi:hypothetical protein